MLTNHFNILGDHAERNMGLFHIIYDEIIKSNNRNMKQKQLKPGITGK